MKRQPTADEAALAAALFGGKTDRKKRGRDPGKKKGVFRPCDPHPSGAAFFAPERLGMLCKKDKKLQTFALAFCRGVPYNGGAKWFEVVKNGAKALREKGLWLSG